MLVNMAKRRPTFLKRWVPLQRILDMSWSGEC